MIKDCMPGFGVGLALWLAASLTVSVFKAATDNCGQKYPIDQWIKSELLCQ